MTTFFNVSKIILAVVAAIVVIFALTATAGDGISFTDMKVIPGVPTEPGVTGDSVMFLVERGNGFFDGCIANGGSTSKCEDLMLKYVQKLKTLVQ